MTNRTKSLADKMQRARSAAKRSLNAHTPPGQHIIDTFPVLDLGVRLNIHRAAWRLRLFGAATQERVLDWDALMRLPQAPVIADFHCVTRRSRPDTTWDGAPAWRVAALAATLSEAHFVALHGYDGYTADLPTEALGAADALLAYRLSGRPLPREHGGPVRMLAPQRYGWENVRRLKSIECLIEDRPGFRGAHGYPNGADPWREECFRTA